MQEPGVQRTLAQGVVPRDPEPLGEPEARLGVAGEAELLGPARLVLQVVHDRQVGGRDSAELVQRREQRSGEPLEVLRPAHGVRDATEVGDDPGRSRDGTRRDETRARLTGLEVLPGDRGQPLQHREVALAQRRVGCVTDHADPSDLLALRPADNGPDVPRDV